MKIAIPTFASKILLIRQVMCEFVESKTDKSRVTLDSLFLLIDDIQVSEDAIVIQILTTTGVKVTFSVSVIARLEQQSALWLALRISVDCQSGRLARKRVKAIA